MYTINYDDWFVIVNPHAGSGKTMSEWAKAEARMIALDIPYSVSLTSHKNHATELADMAAEMGYRKILAVGGDGSVHEALQGIMHFCDRSGTNPDKFFFGVIPIGSGNDWIKSLGVPHDPEAVINLVASWSMKKMDIVKVETQGGVRYMANVGGTGFDSHVCERVNRQKARGFRSASIYAKALVVTMRSITAFHGCLKADGHVVFDGDLYSVAFGNGRYSGGGMRQVPLAELDDGLVDALVVPKASIKTLLKEMPRLLNGSINESKLAVTARAKVIELSGDRDDIVEVDGEIVGNLPLRITMTGQRINVLSVVKDYTINAPTSPNIA